MFGSDILFLPPFLYFCIACKIHHSSYLYYWNEWALKEGPGFYNTCTIKLEAPRSLHRSPGYQSITVCHDMHCLRKNTARNKIRQYHHVHHIKLPQDINLSLKSDKVYNFAIWHPFWKKMAARKWNLIVSSCSPHQKQHIPIWITSLAIILSEILNVKVKKF